MRTKSFIRWFDFIVNKFKKFKFLYGNEVLSILVNLNSLDLLLEADLIGFLGQNHIVEY